MKEASSFDSIRHPRESVSPEEHLGNIITPHTSPEKIMALLSSSYHFTAAVPYMGLVPHQPMTGSQNFPLMGLRIPPYFPGALITGANGGTSLHAGGGFNQGSAFSRLSPEEGKKLVSPPHMRTKHTAIVPLTFTAHHRSAKVVDFSIDGILGNHRTGRDSEEEDMLSDTKEGSETNITVHIPSGAAAENKSSLSEKSPGKIDSDNPLARFSWLQCTRYKPPRLPRTKRKDATKKRKLGRNPRVPFSPAQVATLEQKFRCTHYLSSYDVAELSTALNLSENRVKIWFQNRRARERRDKDAVEKSFNPTIVPASPPVASTSPTLHHTIPSPPVTSSITEERHTSPGPFSDHVTTITPTKALLPFQAEKYPTDLGLVSSSYSPLDFSTK